MMKKPQLARAVAVMADAWRMGTPLAELEEHCRPKTAAEGMQLQDALAAELAIDVGGWKIGCTSKYAQKLLKTDGPFAGRIFAPRRNPGGVNLSGLVYRMRGLEGEFTFVMGKNLKPRKKPYTAAEVKAAVLELRPAIEIVDSRFTDWLAVNTPSLIADMGCNAALILGQPVKGWKKIDLKKAVVKMKVDNKVVGSGKGADVMGDPLLALTWLVNLLRERGVVLEAGQVVSTGTCTGFYKAPEKGRVVADFGKLGRVTFSFV